MLRLFFAIFILIMAVRMVWHIRECAECEMRGSVIPFLVTGWGLAGLPPYSLGYVDLLTFAILAVTTIPVARFGVRFAHSCSGRNLQILFAILMVLIGFSMLLGG